MTIINSRPAFLVWMDCRLAGAAFVFIYSIFFRGLLSTSGCFGQGLLCPFWLVRNMFVLA